MQLEARNVSYDYGSHRALSDISVQLESGRFSLSFQWHWQSFSVSVFSTLVLCLIAIQGFQPQRTRILGSTR